MASRPTRRISAIVPTYNRAAFLGEALDAILSQSAPPDEVIVIDDGSTDQTQAVATRYSAHVTYRKIANSGAPVARGAGAAQATGDWLWFCDSDDLWRPDYLAHARMLMDADPQPRFLFGNFRLVVNGQWSDRTKFETAPAMFWDGLPAKKADGGRIILAPLYESILAFQPIFHSTLVVARSLYDAIGGYDRKFAHTGSEDFEFILRCAAHSPAGMIEEALVGIRRHEGNYSADQLHNLLGEIDILRHARAYHAAANGLEAAIGMQIARRSLQALELAFAAGDYALVRTLAPAAAGARPGIKPRLKMLLSALPSGLRTPAVALAQRAGTRPKPGMERTP